MEIFGRFGKSLTEKENISQRGIFMMKGKNNFH
jgi:hypothetical protein